MRKKIEKFEEEEKEVEIKDTTVQDDKSVPFPETVDEKLKETTDTEHEIDHQEQAEISKQQEKDTKSEDLDNVIKESSSDLLDETKSLVKDTEMLEETSEKESTALLEDTTVDKELKLQDITEIPAQLQDKEAIEEISITTKEDEKEIGKEEIKETAIEYPPTEKQHVLLKKETKSQEETEEIPLESEEGVKDVDLTQVSSTKEDMPSEGYLATPGTLTSTIKEKDLYDEKKEDSPKHKIQEISSGTVESAKPIIKDYPQSDEKEIIETIVETTEIEKEPLDIEKEILQQKEDEKFEDKTKEIKDTDDKQLSIMDMKETLFTDDVKADLTIEEKEYVKYEEIDVSKISEKPSTLSEKEEEKQRDKETILPSTSETVKIQDQIDFESMKEISEHESILDKTATEILKLDLGIKIVEESTLEDSSAPPAEKEKIVSSDESVTEAEIPHKQEDIEITKTTSSETHKIIDSLELEYSEKKPQIEDSTESTEKEKTELSDAVIIEEKKITELDQHTISPADKDEQKQKEKVSPKEVDVVEKETGEEVSKPEATEKDKDRTGTIETKEDQKIISSEEPMKKQLTETEESSTTEETEKDKDKIEIIESEGDQRIIFSEEPLQALVSKADDMLSTEKYIEGTVVTEITQQKKDIPSATEIKEKTAEVSSKEDVCEIKETEISETPEQKLTKDISEFNVSEHKRISEIIPPISTETESVVDQSIKQDETTDICDTEVYKQESITPEPKDVEIKTVEQISIADDIKIEGDTSKTEDVHQQIAKHDESKIGIREELDQKELDKSEQKTAASETDQLDLKESKETEQKLEEESVTPRKESLKTEEKIERDTVITEKDESTKEGPDTQPKPTGVDITSTSAMPLQDEQVILEPKDTRKQIESLDAESEKEVTEQKSYYDQMEDDAGDGEPPPSPGDEYIDSGLEEEPVFTKLETPEHPEYVTVTPDSTPASPKALPSFAKTHEEEQLQTQDVTDVDAKVDISIKYDISKQPEQTEDTKIDEKSEETSQVSGLITESLSAGEHLTEKTVTDTSSKDEEFASSTTTESVSFVTKSVSPPKSPHEITFKDQTSIFETSKTISDQEEIKMSKTYDKTVIAEAKMLDSVDAEETKLTYTSSALSKEVDEFLAMERQIEETLHEAEEKSTTEFSTSVLKTTTEQAETTISDSTKELKETKLDAEESSPTSTSIGETIVSSVSDTKISEKAEIESSEKEIIKSSMEESSDTHTVTELKMTTAESSTISSELASSEFVSVTKSAAESKEFITTEEMSKVTTISSETKEVEDTETLKEDSTLSTTVKKMLVTASSEDGGAETVLCATGTIKTTDSKKQETEDIFEKTTVESETFSKEEKELTKDAEKLTKYDTEADSHSDDLTEKTQVKMEKPIHPTVTDLKHTNGHLHESDMDIQSTDEEEIVDGKKTIKTKTIKTTTTTKVIRKSVSETDSEDEHKDSVTEQTEVGEDGKIITRKVTRTYRTTVKQQDEDDDVMKSPLKSVEIKDSESSKLSLDSTKKEESTSFSEILAGSEPALASTASTTTVTTVTKVMTGSDNEELVKSTTEKVVETDTLKSTTVTTTDEHGDTEVKSFTEIPPPKYSATDGTDTSKVVTESLTTEAKSFTISSSDTHSSDSVQKYVTKDSVETISKSELVETTSSSTAHESIKETASTTTVISKDTQEVENDLKDRDETSHIISGSVSGPLAAIKKESIEMTRSATPGSDAMSERDFDAGGPSTPHSDISSGQVSRAATNLWGSEGRPDSQHYDSDEEEEGPVSPLSVTSQVAPSPPPPQFDFEMPEHPKSPEIEGKHSTIHSVTEEHTEQSSEIFKGPQQALSSSMTSSFYGSLPAEPPLSPPSTTMTTVDPMSASFIMQSGDSEQKSIFSTSTYTYGEYDEGESAGFEHFSSTSQVDPDDSVDFQQALYEHRAARGEDLTSASTSTTYHYETKLKDIHAPEKTVAYEHTSTSGVNGQRKDHSFREFTEDYGNGNLAGAKQFEDLMNRNREPGHVLESKLNGKSADEYSDFSGPASTESYSQEVCTTAKVSTKDPTVLRNGSDEKKTFTTTTVTTVTKTTTAGPETHTTTQSFTEPSTAAQAFPEPPQGFGLPSVSKTETKKDPIEGWGKPLGLPAPAPPPTNNTNAQGEVMAMTNTNKGTPKKEKKVMQMKKSMMISENNKTTGGQVGKDKTKSPESPVKQKAGSNKVGMGNTKSSLAPIYVDLSYVPHHGNSYYTALDFFKKVRARYYVFSGTEPSREVYNALLEAKQTWEDKELEVTIIPTYDTDTLGYWVAENEDALAKCKIDLSPSASRCTINLQDHETSCSAYRLEF